MSNPHVAGAQERLADSDVFACRARMLTRRVHDDEWFFREIKGVPAVL